MYFLRPWAWNQGCACSIFKDLANALARLSRAFEIMFRADFLRDCEALHVKIISASNGIKVSTDLLRSHRSLGCLPKIFNRSRVPSEILFASNEENGQIRAEVPDFRDPLLYLSDV
jgi:hypothetical protein